MASSTNSKMGVTGMIYRETFRPTLPVYWHYKQWRNTGVFDQLMEILHGEVRIQANKKSKWTTLMIIGLASGEEYLYTRAPPSNGFCFYKATNGIKRHLAVDSLGFPFFTHCKEC
jgi:hypothetical protein